MFLEKPMQFINPFQQFNPIKGDLKGPFPIILGDMVKRARNIVKGRTLEEIEYAVSTINYLLNKAEYSSEIKFFGPAQLLLERIKEFDLSNQDSFPKAKWEEYFAILALAAIGELYWCYKEEDEITFATIGLAVEAMEALTIAAASDLAIPELEDGLRKQISLRNRKNAILQHAVVNAWKPKFRDWCYNVYLPSLGNEQPTKRGAARLFKEEFMDPLIKEDQALELADQTDLVRTLADSLPKNFPAREI